MSRKGENIFKRKDGRYEGRYIKEYKGNRAIYGYVYASTYIECKRKRALVSLQKPKTKKRNNPNTLNKLIIKWMDDKDNIKESSFTKYYNIFNEHIKNEIGSLKISKLNDEVVKKYINNKKHQFKKNSEEHLSSSTIYAIANILRQVFKQNDINIKIESIKVITKRGKSLYEDEKDNFEKLLFDKESTVTTGILISLFLGLRESEVCGLKWEDIDFNRKIISVGRIISRVKSFDTRNKTKLIITAPKTLSSNRILPLPGKLYQRMLRQKNNSTNESYLLTGTNKFMDPRRYYNLYKKYLHELNLDYTYHDLRHTFATRCIELGIDAKTLMELMGHANVTTTMNLYVHPTLNNKRYFIDRL